MFDSLKVLLRVNTIANHTYEATRRILQWHICEKTVAVLFLCLLLVSYPVVSLLSIAIMLLFTPWAITRGLKPYFDIPSPRMRTSSLDDNIATLPLLKDLLAWIGFGESFWMPDREIFQAEFWPYQVYFLYGVIVIYIFGFGELLACLIVAVFMIATPSCQFLQKLLMRLNETIYAAILLVLVKLPYTKIEETIDEIKLTKEDRVLWRVKMFENQRWWAGIGWTPELLNSDPGPWSSVTGSLWIRTCDFYNILEGFRIVPWQIYEWEYANSFQSRWNGDGIGSVRRRMWECSFDIPLGDLHALPILNHAIRRTGLYRISMWA